MPENRKIGVIHITLYNFIAKLLYSIFLFCVSAYASRTLTGAQLGLAQYVTWTVNFAWLIFNFGGANTLQRYIAVAYMQHHKQALKRYLLFGVIAGIVSIVLGSLAMYSYTILQPTAQKFPGTIWLLVIQFAVGFLQVMAQSMFRYRSIFYVNLLVSVSGMIFLLNMLEVYKVRGYVWMYMLVGVIQLICYAFIVIQSYRKMPSEPSATADEAVSVRTLLITCLYFGVSAILAAALWQRPELYIVKKYLGFNTIAEYSIALNIVLLLLEPLKMLGGAMQSYFSGMAHLTEDLKRQFLSFYKHYVWLALFCGVALWFEAESIVGFIYTSRYLSAAPLVKILLIGFIPGICTHLMMHLFIGLKRTRYLIIQDIIVATFFAGSLVASLSYISIEWVSILKSVAFGLSFIMAVVYLTMKIHFPFPAVNMLKSVVLSIVLIGCMRLIPGETIELAAARVLLAALMYLGISIRFEIIDRVLLHEVFAEVKRMLRIS